MASWPLTTVLIRLSWLRALCGVAEGATTAAAATALSPCVAALLNDAQKRLCILGGRDGMPWSLGSVLGSFVTRFLGGFRGIESQSIAKAGDLPKYVGIAVTRDGSLLVALSDIIDTIHVYCVATGVHVRTVGGTGDGPLQFKYPRKVDISTDGSVFVSEFCNHRIQILTPRFEFYGFIGVGQLKYPEGLCVSDDIVAVSEAVRVGNYSRICVFSRPDGAFLRRFGGVGSGDGELGRINSLCFMARSCCIAAAEIYNCRVAVFRLNGEFVRHVAAGVLHVTDDALDDVHDIACSDSEELVVAGRWRAAVFSASGDLLFAMPNRGYGAVALRGRFIFAQENCSSEILVLN